MWGNPTFLILLKKILGKDNTNKNYWLIKVDIDTINWERLFNRSTGLLILRKKLKKLGSACFNKLGLSVFLDNYN